MTTAEQPALSDRHQALIDGSAITPEVAAERGYRTVYTKAALKGLGFSDPQCRAPALLVPVYGVTGELATYQIRPDDPRIVDGKALKYETPRKSRLALDVPRRARAWLGDPSRPLFITEGARKADAAVSKDLCAVALLGVWAWRGTNEWGGTTALADWEYVDLKGGRDTLIVFDSDVMTKPGPHGALRRLKPFLEQRGAQVRVVYLPPGEGGTKVGLDDYFVAGGTVEHLLSLAQSELRPLPEKPGGNASGPYYEQGGSVFWAKPVGEGTVPVALANFTARITAEISLDDGVEQRREYLLEAHLGEDRPEKISVPARGFAAMNWPIEMLGARAIVQPGMGTKDHLRAAIQLLSTEIETRTVYGHTGWRDIAGVGWAYLHANGAIGPEGTVSGVQVHLPGSLRGMVLPDPPAGEELASYINRSLDLLELGPRSLTCSLYAAPFRVVMGGIDFSIFLFGPTDTLKTETATQYQSFFGTGFHARNLPGSWLSTGNSLEVLAFVAKDALAVVDDFVPGGSRQDVQRQNRDAERLLRAQGNRAGRGRLGPDAMLRPDKPPRGMILSTGEELPARHSARARTLILEVGRGDVSTKKLTECQRHLADGVHAHVMSAFLSWVAPSYEGYKAEVARRAREHRARAQADHRHRRTASIIAELQAGFEIFLSFAVKRGGLGEDRARKLQKSSWKALLKAAEAQERHQQAAEPAELFVRLLASAIASGRAHVAGPDGKAPADGGEALGWRHMEREPGEPAMHAQGARVGWVDGDDLYLDSDAALRAAQEMASDLERIPVTAVTLGKRLRDKGWLASTDEERDRVQVRRMLEGTRRSVLHLHRCVLTEAAQPSQPAQDPDPGPLGRDLGPEPWAETPAAADETGPENRPTNGQEGPVRGGSGTNGTVGPETETYPGSREAEGPRSRPDADHLVRQVLDLFGGETTVADDPGGRA